jgi:hypothetical protein
VHGCIISTDIIQIGAFLIGLIVLSRDTFHGVHLDLGGNKTFVLHGGGNEIQLNLYMVRWETNFRLWIETLHFNSEQLPRIKYVCFKLTLIVLRHGRLLQLYMSCVTHN